MRAFLVASGVAGINANELEIDRLLREVTALWLCGPAGGGGVRDDLAGRSRVRRALHLRADGGGAVQPVEVAGLAELDRKLGTARTMLGIAVFVLAA